MKFYQLVCKGRMALFDRSEKIYSKRVFSDIDKANEYVPEFIDKCLRPVGVWDMIYLETCDCFIVELEYEE